jgi:hypothetical protein
VDKGEARGIALAQIDDLRRMAWGELRDRYLKSPESIEVRGGSGIVYQVQTQAFWDSQQDGDLRIIVAVDDGSWRAFLPLSEDFIIAPDGSFVDE